MTRLLLSCLALLLTGCSSSPDSEVRQLVKRFLEAQQLNEVREIVFIPPGFNQAQADHITGNALVLLEALDGRASIDHIETRGRWARIELSGAKTGPFALHALKLEEDWRIFWDPLGTLIWGKQEWHKQLSESDWEDYRSLKKAAENPAE
ncbi:MAG: hypothetical protein R3242_07325 [Akkermansiaceae bacterium]|nr:hypothetical protein [Akkermansiaceae bacterium]